MKKQMEISTAKNSSKSQSPEFRKNKFVKAAFVFWSIAVTIYLVFTAGIVSVLIGNNFKQVTQPIFIWCFVTLICAFYIRRGYTRMKKLQLSKRTI